MTSLVLDLLVVAIIALFAILGWKKGLVLTLCGVAAVFVAYFGATFVSQTFSDDLAVLIEPAIQNRLEAVVEAALPDDSGPSPSPLLPIVPSTGEEEEEPDPVSASLEQVMAALRRSTLLTGMYESLTQAITDGAVKVVTSASAAVAHYLACQISQAGLFFLTFFLIVVVWSLLSRALDLACRLPVLRSFNEIGGLLLGLLKGVFLLLAAVGLVTLLGLIPEEVTEQTFLYRCFMNFQLPGLSFS